MPNKLELILTAKDMSAKAFDSFKTQCLSMTRQVVSLNGALVTLAGAGGLGYFVKQTLDATAEIERNARMAGISVEAYQELAYAAGQYMITQDALTDGLKELALRTDEYVRTGGGSAKESFERLGLSQLELNRRLKDTPGLFREIVSQMQGLDKAAQIRIADELFGGQGGEQFVAMIQAGADAIDALRSEARQLGIVMNDDLVRNSVEAKKKIEALTSVLGAQLQVAVADIAPYISEAAGNMLTWVKSNKDFIGQKLPETIGSISDALIKIKEFYDAIPQEVIGPAGLGLIGTALLGPKGGFLLGSSTFLYNELNDFYDGLKGVFAGGIALDEFIGDESVFEKALERYRQSLERPEWANVAKLRIVPKATDADIDAALSDYFNALDTASERLQAEKGKAWSPSVYDPFMHDWKNLQAKANLGGLQSYWHANQDAINRTNDALTEFFGDLDAHEEKLKSTSPFDYYESSFLSWKDVVETGLYSLEDTMVGWISTGKAEWDDFARAVMEDIARMFVQQSVTKPLTGWLGALFSAHGNAFGSSGVMAFAKGAAFSNSVVTSPQLFRFGSGGSFGHLGVVGEAGPELVAPLFRGSGGDMGVKSVPSTIYLSVNIDNRSNSQVTTSQPQWDGSQWVLDIVIEGASQNTRGFKTKLAAVLGGGR